MQQLTTVFGSNVNFTPAEIGLYFLSGQSVATAVVE